MNQPTPPKFHPGQHVKATDGTTGFIQAIYFMFGQFQYVLDQDTVIGEGEIAGIYQSNQ